MKYRFLLAPLMAMSMGAWAQVPGTRLTCVDRTAPAAESKLIRQLAAGVVVRSSKHRLKVSTVGPARFFSDKPPFNEPLSGVRHQFCDRRDGFILLSLEDHGEFKGVLINEASGQVTPGGLEVLFSEDRQSYFATEQPDGLDGELWNIYDTSGKRSWTGYSFLKDERKSGDMIATLEAPQWTGRGELTAQATCLSATDRSWKVTLEKVGEQWNWAPKANCPK